MIYNLLSNELDKDKSKGAPLRLLTLIIFPFSTSQFYLQTMVGFQGSALESFPGLPRAKINNMDMVLCNIDIFLHHYILQTQSSDCYFKIWLYQISGDLEEDIFFFLRNDRKSICEGNKYLVQFIYYLYVYVFHYLQSTISLKLQNNHFDLPPTFQPSCPYALVQLTIGMHPALFPFTWHQSSLFQSTSCLS